MEKKIARITRWLDRCVKACSACAWQSALLDMECAKAELEEVRADLWARAEGAPAPLNVAGDMWRFACVSCLSLLLVLSVAAPLAVQSVRSSVADVPDPVLEWVTADEKALLSAVRKNLSEANLVWISSQENKRFSPESLPVSPMSRELPKVRVPEAKESMRAENSAPADREFDTILTLVQIGQKALREQEPAIRFDSP